MKRWIALACGWAGLAMASAQTCTTQAAMAAATRQAIADRAAMLASAVKAGDANAIKAVSVVALAGNFAAAQYAIQNTADKLGGDSLQVTYVYLLDASGLKAGAEADFTCALAASASEVDFSITGLDAGVYAFAMVEAAGSRPWLLSFLLRQDGTVWKLAGLYPHARTAAGKDGLWYWNDARAKVAANQKWLAWLDYGEAETLLTPAPFFSSTNLDKLRSEQREAAPAELADGISAEQPLVLKGANGQDFHVTSLASEGTDGGQSLRLVLHYAATSGAAPDQPMQAAAALLLAHPELRQAYQSLLVFGDVPEQNPLVFSGAMTQIAP